MRYDEHGNNAPLEAFGVKQSKKPVAREAIARPFIKRPGGKTQLLPELRQHVPARFKNYVEPFVGGGALFFDLKSSHNNFAGAVLGDSDRRLINAWRWLRWDVDSMIARLKTLQGMWDRRAPDSGFHNHQGRRAFYEMIRASFNADGDTLGNAARLIFLNKTSYNGIWRVNAKGEYNVPMGKSKSPVKILDAENLRAVARALKDVDIVRGSFKVAFADAKRGDFLYADPPYWPVSESADFTTYTARGFSRDDQEELRDCARKAKERGVRVLLSNADVPGVRKLYKKGFEMRTVAARRSVNCRGKKRGVVGELLIW